MGDEDAPLGDLLRNMDLRWWNGLVLVEPSASLAGTPPEGMILYPWVEHALRTAPEPVRPRRPDACPMPVYVVCSDDSHPAKVARIARFGHGGVGRWALLAEGDRRVGAAPLEGFKYQLSCRLCGTNVEVRPKLMHQLLGRLVDHGRFRVSLRTLALAAGWQSSGQQV